LVSRPQINPEALAEIEPSPREMDALWADLAGDDAARAYRAAWTLVLAPRQAVPWLRERLRPVPSVDASRIARLIADLEDDSFAIRQKAMKELAALGELAGPALKKALADHPTLEMRRRAEELLQRLEQDDPPPERLRALRSITVLERIGTPDAREVLLSLSKGAAGAGITQEAADALERLARRHTAP
jgi:hypothetical protein